jgi:hypothetical protein
MCRQSADARRVAATALAVCPSLDLASPASIARVPRHRLASARTRASPGHPRSRIEAPSRLARESPTVAKLRTKRQEMRTWQPMVFGPRADFAIEKRESVRELTSRELSSRTGFQRSRRKSLRDVVRRFLRVAGARQQSQVLAVRRLCVRLAAPPAWHTGGLSAFFEPGEENNH